MAPATPAILLVEDDPSLSASLRLFLEDHGFSTSIAASCAIGAQLLRSSHPPICLLDMNLPDGSGIDLLRMIVQERLPVRVIVMTAFPIDHLRARFPASVLIALLTKPVSPQDLLDEVNKISAMSGCVFE